jgi:hypothetical protein
MFRSINFSGDFSVSIPSQVIENEHTFLLAAFLFPISMFWFAWAGRPPINMYASLTALAAFGMSGHISASSRYRRRSGNELPQTVFLSVSDFTVESYGLMASSAVTGQSFARGTLMDIKLTCIVFISTPPEILCGVLSLVGVQFYENGKCFRFWS